MKKQTKMVCLILTFAAVLIGCKKNERLQSGSDVVAKNNSTLSGADGKWDLLGFGLDATGNLSDGFSLSDVTIFDMIKFEQDFIDRIDSKINITRTSIGTEQYFGGASAYDYMKDVHNKKSFDISGNVKIPVLGGLNLTRSFSKNSSDKNTTTFSSKYSYATYEVTQTVKRIRFTGDVSMELLAEYLTSEFVNNVANLSAEDLVKRYGTHVLLDISIGGQLRFNYSGVIVNESTETKKTSSVKAGMGVGLSNIIGVEINADKSKEEITKMTNETREREYTGVYYGGTNSGKSISIDKDGNTAENINIANWQQSIHEKNAALIDVGRAVFLYDFIADPIKKAQVKAAVEKYIKERQIEMTMDYSSELINIYSYAKYDGGQHFLSTATGEGSFWKNEGVQFLAYKTQIDNSIPIRRLRPKNLSDNLYTSGYADSYWNVDLGIVFYAYTKQVPGTIPIYDYTNKSGSDHYYSPNIERDPYWVRHGVPFYAYPKP